MPLTRFAFLFRKYYQKTATPEEEAEFMRLADMEEHAVELRELMELAWSRPDDVLTEPDSEMVFTESESETMLRQVLGVNEEVKVVGRRRWMGYAAAAVLAGALGLGGWWWANRVDKTPVQVVAIPRSVVKPGGNKAVLVLANGSTVTLDSTKDGVVATQGMTNVVKVAGGQLAYSNGGADGGGAPGAGSGGLGGAAVLFNTIRTPRGGQYQVVLPDGSRVWLNAATALRFPTSFSGASRTVELTGEAYFEIAPRKDQPFHVKVGEMTVDVLGTHFNVMAYDDEESFSTTLLTGAVRVEGDGKVRLLKPGEEARLSLDTKDISVAEADTDQVVAWKNGLFQFEGTRLEDVMRQLARWYDIDVHYAGKVERHFSGMIARKAPLADVLHVLERAGKTNFTLEGRTVTVTPK